MLIVGDAAVPTGFARVLRSIFEPLTDTYEIHHLATSYGGDPHDYPWHLYPAHLGGDQWGVNRLGQMIEALEPSLVFVLQDIWVQVQYMQVLRQYAQRTKILLYIPIDAEPIPADMAMQLHGAHQIFTFTEFSRRVLIQAGVKSVEVMPLGVDTQDFYPLHGDPAEARRQARQALFGDAYDDLFVVLNANRNQTRKRVDITIKGFAQFAADKPPQVKLFLHMGMKDLGWDIPALAARYGVQERLMLTTQAQELPNISTQQLNLIYNACQVGVNTSVGESWGLVSFEHGATRAAQVVPDHSGCGELWQNAAELLTPAMSLTNATLSTEEWYIAPKMVAAALERLYADENHLREMAEIAYANAIQEMYQWKHIAARWGAVLEDVLS